MTQTHLCETFLVCTGLCFISNGPVDGEIYSQQRAIKICCLSPTVVLTLQPEHTWPQTSCRFTLIVTEQCHSLSVVFFYLFIFFLLLAHVGPDLITGVSVPQRHSGKIGPWFNSNMHSSIQKHLSIKEVLEIPTHTHTHTHTHAYTHTHTQPHGYDEHTRLTPDCPSVILEVKL